jgi:hypothetical protein
MPDHTDHLTALRGRHSGRVYVSLLTGTPVLTGTLGAAPTLPALALSYTLTGGDAANVKPGMRVVVTNGGAYKGTLSVRYAGSITSSSLPVREYADLNLSAGDTITVYDDFVLTDKLAAGDETFAPDHAAYTDQNSDPAPVATSGGWWAGWIGIDIPFTGSGSFTVDPDSSGTLTHLWTAPGGAFVVGTSTSADPTIRYSAAGGYLVTHTVTDAANGTSETQYVRVRVHDADDPPYECRLSSVEGDAHAGFRCSFNLFENADMASLPDGASVIVWTDGESYGSAAAGRSQIVCAGCLRRDRSRGDADGDQIEFEVLSPLARLAELPGFSKIMEREQSPDAWSEIKALTVKRGIVQLLRHYTNTLHLFDLGFDGVADADYPAFYLQKAAPYDQVMELADSRDARLTCDRAGRLTVLRRLELTPLADRAAITTTITLNTDDVIDYEISREHGRAVETFRARGFTAGTEAAQTQPVFARYPASPGTGSASPVSERLIVDDAADLYERCALRAAWHDRVYIDSNGIYRHAPEARITLFGGYAQLVQFYREWIKLDGVTNLRGVDLAAFRFIPLRVRVDYADGTATTMLDLRAETYATGAVDDTPAAEIAAPTDPPVIYPSIIITDEDGGHGLGVNTETLAVFDATNGKVWISADFDRLPTGGTPTFTGYSLGLTTGGGLASFVVRADSPRYVTGNGAVNGYLATRLQARTISDVFGTRTLGAAYSYAATAAYYQVQLQTERGNPDWALAAVHHDGIGVRVYRTTDGGATWAAQSSLPTAYDTLNGATWQPGLWMNPDGSGEALVSAARVVGSPPLADFWRTTDYGATWSKIAGLNAGDYPCGCIVKPLARGSVIFHGEVEYIPGIVQRSARIIDATQAAISPGTDVTPYGFGAGFGERRQRAFAVADDDPNAVVLVGAQIYVGLWGVFQTFNALDAAPTWNPLIAPGGAAAVKYRGAYYVSRGAIYLYGDGGALALCRWNGSAWTIYEMTVSGCGAIVGMCGG